MTVDGAVRDRGGAAHTAELRQLGITPHHVRRAVDAGAVRRLRRSWLVTPECDPHVRRAVAVGGRVSCVTEAARRGLWVPAHEGSHVAVPSTSSRIDAHGLHLHWSAGPMPVARHATSDPLVNVLARVAECQAPRDALAVWESALRSGAVDREVVERVRWHGASARQFASTASALSDSGLETRFVLLMRSIGIQVRQQVWIDGHPIDGVLGDRLLVQIDGFEHHRAADRRRDLRADARLALRGYTVLRFDYYQVLFAPDEVVDAVATALAQGLHLAAAR